MRTLNPYSVNKWLLCGLPMLALCLIIACSKKDDDATTGEMTFTSFSPTSGEAGETTVTLVGANFNTSLDGNTVKFGAAKATVTSAKANELQVTVPETAETSTISVATNGTTVTSKAVFTVKPQKPAPTIAEFTPTEGEWGTEVTITGTNFSTVIAENEVKFGELTAVVNTAKSNELTVVVPNGAITGSISVSTGGSPVTSANEFTILFPDPTIDGFDPVQGEWGTEVTIGGANFFEEHMQVYFKDSSGNLLNAEVLEVTNTSLLVKVPNNARTGEIMVLNSTSEVQVTSNEEFTVFHGRWTKIADFGGNERIHAIAYTLNGKGYVGLGSGTGNAVYKDIWEYDPNTDIWSKQSDFTEAPNYANSSFVIENTPYIGCGSLNNVPYNDFWKYNANADEWTSIESLNGAPRSESFSFVINGKGYIGGGVDAQGDALQDFWEYDPGSNSWSQKPNFTNGRRRAAYFVINGKAFVGTGSKDHSVLYKDFWEYDPEANTWTQKADFNATKGIGRTGAIGFAINGRGYLGGGLDKNDNGVSDFWEYDPTNDTWIRVADYKGPSNSRTSVFVIDGKAYVGLGYSDSGLEKEFWVFDPGN